MRPGVERANLLSLLLAGEDLIEIGTSTIAGGLPHPMLVQRPRPEPIEIQRRNSADLDAAPAVHAVQNAEVGSPDISFHAFQEFDVVRFRAIADYYVWPHRIICHLRDSSLAWLIEIQLLGMVLALWLEKRGIT